MELAAVWGNMGVHVVVDGVGVEEMKALDAAALLDAGYVDYLKHFRQRCLDSHLQISQMLLCSH